MRSRMRTSLLILLVGASVFAPSADAQNRQIDPNLPLGIFKNFLGVVQDAQQKQQAREAWGRVDPAVVTCMQQTYSPPPETLAVSGVAPTDPRIAAFYNRCVQSVATGRIQQQQTQQQQQATQQQQQATEQQRKQQEQAAAEEQARQAEAKLKQQQAEEERQRTAKAKADADERKRQEVTAAEERKRQELAAGEERKRKEAANKLRSDPVLVGVLGPDKRTVTVLVVGQDTSNVVRNLKGEPVFQKLVSACLPFGAISADPNTIEWRFLDGLQGQIAVKGGAPISMTLCTPAELRRYDLLIFTSAQVADAALEVLSPVVDALRKHQLILFGKYSIADFEAQEKAKLASAEAEEQRKEAKREEAVKTFGTRDATIVSAIYLQSPAPSICLIASSDTEGLRYLLQRPDSPFVDLAGKSTFREFPSADAVFIALKKRECVAAIAPAGALRAVVSALTRDGLQIDIHGGTVEVDKLTNWRKIKGDELVKAQGNDATSKLQSDPALVGVLGTDKRTVTVLVVGQDTPNVVRNLKGEPVFQKLAPACLPFGAISADPNTIEWRFLDSLKGQIAEKGGAPISMTLCTPAELGRFDLLMFSSAQVTDGSLDVLTPLVDALRKGQLVLFGKYNIEAFESGEKAKVAAAQGEEDRRTAAREEAVKSFGTRNATITSAIYLQSPAPTVCLIASNDPEGLHYLLLRPDSPFADLAGQSAFREYPSADAVFIALKKHECVAAIAPAGDLRDVADALTRGSVKVEIHPGIIEQDRLANWRKLKGDQLATAQEDEARRVAEGRRLTEQRNIEDQQKRVLEEQRRKNDEAARREELERMRGAVASKAQAVVDAFSEQLKRHMESVVSEVNDTKARAKIGQVLSAQEQTALRAKYDAQREYSFDIWATDFEARVKEGWEFSDIRPQLEDYGLAQWKSRKITAVAVRVEFPMLNRAVGDRRTDCEEFYWINDEEFGYMRQSGVVACAKYASAFVIWSQQNLFESQWKLLSPSPPTSVPVQQSGTVPPSLPNPPQQVMTPGAQQLSGDQLALVRQQLERCWKVSAAANEVDDLIVDITAEVNRDGRILTAEITSRARMGDPSYRATAESALRAVLNPQCGPLKLPPDKYEQWQNLYLHLNPRDVL
jgi:hypothetical protein